MTNLQANVLLLLAAFFWGIGHVAQKAVLTDLGPLTAVGCESAPNFDPPWFRA